MRTSNAKQLQFTKKPTCYNLQTVGKHIQKLDISKEILVIIFFLSFTFLLVIKLFERVFYQPFI